MKVAFDTETTGLVPGLNYADVISVAGVLLDEGFQPRREFNPLYMLIKPKRFEESAEYRKAIAPALKVNGLDIDFIMTHGHDPIRAAEIMDEWWMTYCKSNQIEALAQNWPFDRAFLMDWLGPLAFSHYFSRYYRDTYTACAYLNDSADSQGMKKPFKEGLSLNKLCKALGITNTNPHNALGDAVTTAEVYRACLKYIHIPNQVASGIKNGEFKSGEPGTI